MSESSQAALLNLMVLLSVEDNFKREVIFIYFTNFRQLFPAEPQFILEDPRTSKLLDLHDQIVFLEDVSLLVLEIVPLEIFLDNIIELVNLYCRTQTFTGSSKIIGGQAFLTLKALVKHTPVATKFFANRQLVDRFFMIIRLIQIHRPKYSLHFNASLILPEEFTDLEEISKNALIVEKHSAIMFRDICATVSELDPAEKEIAFTQIFRSLASHLQAAKNQTGSSIQAATDWSLERAFAIFMVGYIFFDKRE